MPLVRCRSLITSKVLIVWRRRRLWQRRRNRLWGPATAVAVTAIVCVVGATIANIYNRIRRWFSWWRSCWRHSWITGRTTAIIIRRCLILRLPLILLVTIIIAVSSCIAVFVIVTGTCAAVTRCATITA